MTQYKTNRTVINRRSFVAGAVSIPIAASSVGPISSATASVIGNRVQTIQLASVFNTNMMQRWTWHFSLEQYSDGTFTLVGTQLHEFPEDEPWEIEPRTGLRSGRDVFQVLDAELNLVDAGMSNEVVASTGKALAEIDPSLAQDFLREAEEVGLEEIET
ncbi:hypothetical protein [Tateyamaria sp.]|uniref:hypothetical protein n=1 Tax=Tateyamaria sp. TaxID=1929288 RepID=UPI00329F1FA3